jgi:hypothetical protein
MQAGMWCSLAGVLLGLVLGVTEASPPAKVIIQSDKGYVDFLLGAELVGRYHYQDSWSQAKPIFWPLHAPGGIPLTRAWPMEPAGPGSSHDHPHQKSAWFCHGEVIAQGLKPEQPGAGERGIDFWSEGKGHGRIVCVAVARLPEGVAGIQTRNEWRTAGGEKILEEARRITLHDLGTARLFVLEIDLSAPVYPIIFGDTKEGALGVRVADALCEKKPGQGTLRDAQGREHERAIWGQQAAWCDYSGPVQGQVVGITLMDDPKNPYPACWHARSYGLLAANPFGRGRSGFPAVRGRTDRVRLALGEHLHLRYGILLHRGDANSGQVAEHYRRFVALRVSEQPKGATGQ